MLRFKDKGKGSRDKKDSRIKKKRFKQLKRLNS
jgi:hypothetical protein